MVVDCVYCEARVDAKVIGEHEAYDPNEDPSPYKTWLLECPNCKNTLVAGVYVDHNPDGDAYWGPPIRLWPSPERSISLEIPKIVRLSLEEADRCYKAGAYSACAVMCGRSLEGIARYHNTKSRYLGGGLQELLERKIIDGRLFQWAEELQKSRNIGAHATDEIVTKQDARDLLDFVYAICEYVFVLNNKFETFMKRKATEKDNT